LTSQLDAIFADQGLPRLGYMNDLLYIAAVINVAAGESISIGVTPANGSATECTQATLSSPYGFADFVTSGGKSVRIARPVAVAETNGNAPGSYNAIVRMRQDGQSDGLSLQLYVDDYNGTVAGLSPGDTGYGAAAKAAAINLTLSDGTTTTNALAGPGFGNMTEATMSVQPGEIIAMLLNRATPTPWAAPHTPSTASRRPTSRSTAPRSATSGTTASIPGASKTPTAAAIATTSTWSSNSTSPAWRATNS
jgi:hypothetical protein